ncbi:MAG: hypothetical protein KJ709_07965 [Nanoarchaeota archaeon]|nr:hypothetical protein [Nanoarchaeota archaeon]
MAKCPYCNKIVKIDDIKMESTGWLANKKMFSCPHCESILGMGFWGSIP